MLFFYAACVIVMGVCMAVGAAAGRPLLGAVVGLLAIIAILHVLGDDE